MESLRPGQEVGLYRIVELLSWNPRGGVYRVIDSEGPKLLKELIFPSDLPPADRRKRQAVLEQAVRDWQGLDHPQRLKVLDLFCFQERIYLVLEELEASTLAVQIQLRPAPPEPSQTVRWAEQLASLVEKMLQQRHPLAFETLRQDRILIDGQHQLVVFNPGWSELLWQDAERLTEVPLQEGLRRWGELIQLLSSGYQGHPGHIDEVPAGLIWVISRCLQPQSGRAYGSFGELRKALRGLKIFGDEALNQKVLGALPPVVNFLLPRLAALPRPPGWVAWLALVLVLLFLGGGFWMWSRFAGPPPVRPGLALAVGRNLYLARPQWGVERLWRFPAPILAMDASPDGSQLYVILEGRDEIHTLDPDQREVTTLTLESRPLALTCAAAGKELQVYLQSQRLLRLNLHQAHHPPLDSVLIAPGLSGWHYRSLPHLPARASLITLHSARGLNLYDVPSEELLRALPLVGYSTFLPTPRGELLLFSNTGNWLFLDENLQVQNEGRISVPAGVMQLRVASVDGHFWSLQLRTEGQTVLGWWQTRQFGLVESLKVESSPLVAAVDDKGHLYWADNQRRLFKASPNPLTCEVLLKLPGPPQAMVYLGPDLRPRGLQRLMEQPPPGR